MRITREQMFMEMAYSAAKRSTCFRKGVGAILVRRNNIVSMGYNGPMSGEPHCQGNQCPLENKGCARSIHAEINAINRAYIYTDDWQECELFCTTQPCLGCANEIALRGIKKVIFTESYRLTDGLEYLQDHGIKVLRLSTGGYLIDTLTNEILNEIRL